MTVKPLKIISAFVALAWLAVMIPSRWYMPDQSAVDEQESAVSDVGEKVTIKASGIEVGQWYSSQCNPFGELRVRVLEIKDGWVRYEHTDGSGSPKRIDDFEKRFCKTPYYGK